MYFENLATGERSWERPAPGLKVFTLADRAWADAAREEAEAERLDTEQEWRKEKSPFWRTVGATHYALTKSSTAAYVLGAACLAYAIVY